MIQIHESDLSEEETKENSQINQTKQLKIGNNCLITNKGQVKERDKLKFKECCLSVKASSIKDLDQEEQNITFAIDNYGIHCDFITKTHKSFEDLPINSKLDDCGYICDLRVYINRSHFRASHPYFGQRKLSSRRILAEMLC